MSHDVVPATQGFGPLLQRDYWAVFAGSPLKPSQLMAQVTSHFCELPAAALVQFTAPSGLHRGAGAMQSNTWTEFINTTAAGVGATIPDAIRAETEEVQE